MGDPTPLERDGERSRRRLGSEVVADAQVDVGPFHAGDGKPRRGLARHNAALVGRAAAVAA
jgi:hypothetical protein